MGCFCAVILGSVSSDTIREEVEVVDRFIGVLKPATHVPPRLVAESHCQTRIMKLKTLDRTTFKVKVLRARSLILAIPRMVMHETAGDDDALRTA